MNIWDNKSNCQQINANKLKLMRNIKSEVAEDSISNEIKNCYNNVMNMIDEKMHVDNVV